MKTTTPAAARAFGKEFDMKIKEVKEYVISQLGFFEKLGNRATDEDGWIAFKMGCTREQAAQVIAWAKESA